MAGASLAYGDGTNELSLKAFSANYADIRNADYGRQHNGNIIDSTLRDL